MIQYKVKLPVVAASMLLLSATSVFADGKSDYDGMCFACHGSGIAGAPKLGDTEAWKDRIAQGNDELYKNAIEGFTGETGMMPAKGGFAGLSDDQVKAVVDYMVESSQ